MTPKKAERWEIFWMCLGIPCTAMAALVIWHYKSFDAFESKQFWFWATFFYMCVARSNKHEYWRRGYLAAQPKDAPKTPRCTCTAFRPSSVTINGAPTCRYCGLLP